MNEQTITLKLTVSEFNFLHAILGDLPTKTNAWVLLNNLEGQAKAQAEAQNIPVVNPGQPAAEAAPAAE
jgi:hypothetical protein